MIISGCDEATFRETLKSARPLNLNICETMAKPVDLEMLRHVLERLRSRQTAPVAA